MDSIYHVLGRGSEQKPTSSYTRGSVAVPLSEGGQGERLLLPTIHAEASQCLSLTGGRVDAWCLGIHAEASLSLYVCLSHHVI